MEPISTTVTLPSGVEAEIREMTGAEEDLFADEKLVKSGKIGDRLLGNVVKKLNGEKPTSKDIQEMWTADRTAAMLHTRILTFGEDLEAEHECQNEECRQGILITIDNLLDDLEYTPAPESFEHEIELPNGKTAVIRPGKGSDEQRLLQARQKGELMTELLFTRIVSVEGIESRQELRHFLRNGSLRVRRAISNSLQEVEFGYRTTIPVTCHSCGTEQDVDVQGLRGFFFPETPGT